LDFAGGGPVEISSGMGALAYSIMLGPRHGVDHKGIIGNSHRPHSVSNVVLGTTLLWFGWFGFNAGSASGASLQAVMAFFVTNIAGSVGGITWILMDYRRSGKLSVVGV
jgi:ammonium transporter, Amt family